MAPKCPAVWLREGRVPLQTLRANIDYAKTQALTTSVCSVLRFGFIKVKLRLKRKKEQLNPLKVFMSVSENLAGMLSVSEVVIMLMPKQVKYRKQMRTNEREGLSGVGRFIW